MKTATLRRPAGLQVPTPLVIALCAASSIAVLLAGSHLPWPARAAIIVVGGAAAIGIADRPDVSVRLALVAIGVTGLVAVAVPSRGSGDVWSYEMYGRIAVLHHANPFVHPPAAFPADPFLQRVNVGWRSAPSVYGPVFLAVAGLGARVAGGSAIVARLWFQLAALAALAGALALLWFRNRNPAVLASLGLQPVVMVSIVNGGHPDLLVGLAVLAAVCAVERGRNVTAGVFVGLGALVKVTGALALIGLVPWLLWRRGRSAGTKFAAAAAITIGLGYAPVGPDAFRALHGATGHVSRASIWQIARQGLGLASGNASWTGVPAATLLGAMALIGGVGVVAVAAGVVHARGHDPSPVPVTAGVVGAYPFVASYALPWYSGWWLPTAVARRDPASRFLAAYATVMLAAYQIPTGFRTAGGTELRYMVSYALPVVALATFLLVELRGRAGPLGVASIGTPELANS